MKRRRRKNKSILAMLVVAGVLASATYAFTASITVPGTQAGDGNSNITIPNVSAVAYNLLGSDPTKIASMDLTFSSGLATAAKIKAKISTTAVTWTNNCTATNPSGGTATIWNCAYAASSEQAFGATGDNLRVVAVQ